MEFSTYSKIIRMKKKVVLFHPAIAPYRVDFFNSLNDAFDAEFYFEFHNVLEQSFKQQALIDRLHFTPHYLKKGLFGIKNLRWQILSILRQTKPDLVICSEYNLTTVLVLLYKWLFQRSLEVISICDDSCGTAATEGLIKQWSRSLLVQRLDGIILTNLSIFNWYQTHLKRYGRLLYFPIIQKDEQVRTQLCEALPISQNIWNQQFKKGQQILLFVGRLIAIKNLHFLLEALNQIKEEYPDAILLLVGEGEEQQALQQKVVAYGLEKRVIFVGKQEGATLYAYYNLGQIFILPSYYERFGAVVNEALLAGCYTLCSSAAGAACLIQEGVNGALFDPHNVADLAQTLRMALSQTAPLQQVTVKPNQMLTSYSQYLQKLLKDFSL